MNCSRLSKTARSNWPSTRPIRCVTPLAHIAISKAARLPDRQCSSFRSVHPHPPAQSAGGGGGYPPQVFIASKNSELLLDSLSLLIRNSSPSTVPIGVSTRRNTHILDNTLRSTSNSSLRVPDLVMSIDGKVRLSATLRSSTISELPVPLNSSKITSSMREPVSISAVEMIVSDPPSSMLRAAPKKRFGRCSALASTPPVSPLPAEGTTVL